MPRLGGCRRSSRKHRGDRLERHLRLVDRLLDERCAMSSTCGNRISSRVPASARSASARERPCGSLRSSRATRACRRVRTRRAVRERSAPPRDADAVAGITQSTWLALRGDSPRGRARERAAVERRSAHAAARASARIRAAPSGSAGSASEGARAEHARPVRGAHDQPGRRVPAATWLAAPEPATDAGCARAHTAPGRR